MINLKEVRIKSSQCDLYILGYTCATMKYHKKLQKKLYFFKVKLKKFSKFELYAATCVYEDGITSNRKSERCGEYVP